MAQKSIAGAYNITIVDLQAGTSTVIHKKEGKKRIPKSSRQSERATRIWLEAMQVYASRALQLHNRSNRERSNGWMVDRQKNNADATKRARKILNKL
nr:hypothetical protein [Cystobacter sp.]